MLIRHRTPIPPYRRQRIDTPDGDFIDLDWLDAPATPQPSHPVVNDAPLEAARGARAAGAGYSPTATPLVILFHGLEGSANSHYARALMHAVAQQGWNGVVVHFRGCSGEPNRLPRAYHSGDSAEVAWIVQRLRARLPASPLFAVGVSLGGNALLKYLGERGAQGKHTDVMAAAAASVPYDLSAADRNLSRWPGILYARHFLKTLVPASLAKAVRFPGHKGLDNPAAMRAARTLKQFDDVVTAPLHGFKDADDYYTRSSSAQYLHGIAIPTLLVHAENDPFLPPDAIPVQKLLSPTVKLEITAKGGHAGFVEGPFPGNVDWLPRRMIEEFQRALVQHSGSNRVR